MLFLLKLLTPSKIVKIHVSSRLTRNTKLALYKSYQSSKYYLGKTSQSQPVNGISSTLPEVSVIIAVPVYGTPSKNNHHHHQYYQFLEYYCSQENSNRPTQPIAVYINATIKVNYLLKI